MPIDQIIELVTNQQMIEMEKILGGNSIAEQIPRADSRNIFGFFGTSKESKLY